MIKKTTILSQGDKQLQLCNKARLGTWNTRSMSHLEYDQLLGEEMMRLGVDICEMGRTRTFHNTGWPHSSILRSTYSGNVRSGSLN